MEWLFSVLINKGSNSCSVKRFEKFLKHFWSRVFTDKLIFISEQFYQKTENIVYFVVLLMCLKNLIGKNYILIDIHLSNICRESVVWNIRSFIFSTWKRFEKTFPNTKFINYRRNNYKLFQKFISFLQLIQKMKNTSWIGWKNISNNYSFCKNSSVNVFNWVKKYSERYVS